jgi:hypothetical protein
MTNSRKCHSASKVWILWENGKRDCSEGERHTWTSDALCVWSISFLWWFICRVSDRLKLWNERFSSTNELLIIPLFFLWSIWPPGGRLLLISYGPWNNTGIKSMCDQKWGDWNLVKFGETWLLFGKWRLEFWVSHQRLGKAVSGDIKLSGRF